MTARAVVAEFYRAENGVPRMVNLTVIKRMLDTDGQEYFSRTLYDVDWSKTSGCYLFHMSGGGGGERVTVQGPYYASGPAVLNERPTQWCGVKFTGGGRDRGTRLARKRNPTHRMLRLPRHVDLQPGEDLLHWLEWNNIEQDAVWCSECDDMVRGDYLCDHTWWCDKVGWYSTPTEPCGHERGECES